jgi:hypothetical protein
MAVRFPGTSGNFFSRNADLPAMAALTVSWWVRLTTSVTNRNNPFTIYADASNYVYFQTRGDNGTFFQIQFAGNGSNVLNIVDVGVGNWYFMALVINGASIVTYYASVTDLALSNVSTSASSATWWTPAHMRLSQRPDTFGRIDGRLASVKIWTAALTETELNADRWSYRPARTENLHLWTPIYDLAAARIEDYSGAGRDWTSNGASITDEDGPPIAFGSPYWFVHDLAAVIPPAPADPNGVVVLNDLAVAFARSDTLKTASTTIRDDIRVAKVLSWD